MITDGAMMNQSSSRRRETVEDALSRATDKRDLRTDEHGLDQRDLAAGTPVGRRPEERDGGGDGRRVEQRDGQLEREAQAEVERSRRALHRSRSTTATPRPHEDLPIRFDHPGFARATRQDLAREEAGSGNGDEQLEQAARGRPRRPRGDRPTALSVVQVTGSRSPIPTGIRSAEATASSGGGDLGALPRRIPATTTWPHPVRHDVAAADDLTDRRRDRRDVAQEQQPVVRTRRDDASPPSCTSYGSSVPPDRSRRSPLRATASPR